MRVIAYYLPQFHQIKENDEWWGQGFTEWDSVRCAKPLFSGHTQPRVPAQPLGYYNLMNPEVRLKQAKLAKEAGVEGFCYWHYWFKGKQLLEKPFLEVLETRQPNFPFCLAWANESWKAKEWSVKSGKNDKILIEQTYSDEDNEAHFNHLLSAFNDDRYIKIDNKPLFVIYKPFDIPDVKNMISKWNDLAVKSGFNGIFFVGHTLYSTQRQELLNLGFDAVNVVPLGDCRRNVRLLIKTFPQIIKYAIGKEPFVYKYKDIIDFFCQPYIKQINVFPTILPNWDHSPRSGINAMVIRDSNPELFAKMVRKVKETISHCKSNDKQVVFLKSWNEWGEGNYMEPDTLYGMGYINALKNVLNE